MLLSSDSVGVALSSLFTTKMPLDVFSNPNWKHHIPCLSKEEGMRQTLEELFQQEILPDALEEERPFKDNYLRIRERWFSLKNSTSLDAKLFDVKFISS